jgi:4-coumarate--CoA ligase
MTVTPANSAYNVTELTYQLKLSKAKAIITEKNALKDAVAAAKNVGIDEKCILIVEEAAGGYKCWKDILVNDETIALEKNDPNSRALLCFSSGTTGISLYDDGLMKGLPKAVMLSHRNVVAAVMMFADINGRYLTHHDVFCGVLPFYHIGYYPFANDVNSSGLSFTLLLSIYMGLKVVVMRRFDLEKWLEVVQKYGVTYAHVAPPISILPCQCHSRY